MGGGWFVPQPVDEVGPSGSVCGHRLSRYSRVVQRRRHPALCVARSSGARQGSGAVCAASVKTSGTAVDHHANDGLLVREAEADAEFDQPALLPGHRRSHTSTGTQAGTEARADGLSSTAPSVHWHRERRWGPRSTQGRSVRFRRWSWWSCDRIADAQTCHPAALGVSVGRLAELGVAIKPALDRQTVVGLGGLDDITDIAAWVIQPCASRPAVSACAATE